MGEPVGPAASRLRALDVFRGLTIAGMLVVNDPGDAATVYAPLAHSAWHGWTPTDLVFPFFLFVVGITTHLSLARRAAAGDDPAALRRQVLRRAAALFAIGLLLNWYPFYQSGAIAGHADPSVLDRIAARLIDLRLLGVLQRVALAYLAAGLIALDATSRRVAAWAAALLLGYWALMTLVPVPGEHALGAALLDDRARTLAAWSDRALLDWSRWGLGNHLWRDTRTSDPEGPLSTIPAIASTLLGVLAGRWLASARPVAERLTALGAAGAIAASAGVVWGWWFPINKPIWTSSYAVLTAGIACLALASIGWLVDVARWDRWARPFLAFGRNAILAYVGAEWLARVLHSTVKWKLGDRRVGTEMAFTHAVRGLGVDPRAASLAWALLYVLLWYAIVAALDRRRIYLKV